MDGLAHGGRLKKIWSRPEIVPAILLLIAFYAGAKQSPFFLDARYLFDATSLYVETGLVALGMTLIIISGNIDLSVGSSVALVGCVVAKLMASGVPVPVACLAGLALGSLLGLANGLLVARLRLPSFLVTLSTMALYRGVAQVLLDTSSVPLPESFVGVDKFHVAKTPIPAPLLVLLVTALIVGLVLHRTVFGRWVFALGTNESASVYSGVPTARVKVLIFTITGLLAGFGGLFIDSRLAYARFDLANGMELDAITAVVLGGASIAGGQGTIGGTVIALFLVATVKTGMGLANVKAEYQLAVIGTLLILSVIVTNVIKSRSSRRA